MTDQAERDPGAEPCVVMISQGDIITPQDIQILGPLLGRFSLSTAFLSDREYRERFAEAEVDSPPVAEATDPIVSENSLHAQLEKIRHNGYRFTDITSPIDIVLREHFEDFRVSLHPELSRQAVGRSFHALVNGRGDRRERLFNLTPGKKPKWEQVSEPSPLAGIELVRRSDVGFPAYSLNQYSLNGWDAQIMAGYGMVASSILETRSKGHIYKCPPATLLALETLMDELRQQLAASS